MTDIQRRYSHVGGKAVNIKDFDLLKVCGYGWVFLRFRVWVVRWCVCVCVSYIGPPRACTHPMNQQPPPLRCWARGALGR